MISSIQRQDVRAQLRLHVLRFNSLPRSSAGGLRVQLLRAAGGAGGVAGGGRIPHQLTGKPLQRKPLRQHRLIPGAPGGGDRTVPEPESSRTGHTGAPQRLLWTRLHPRLRRWRRPLQALAAAFAAVRETSHCREKSATGDYSSRSLLSRKAAGVACKVPPPHSSSLNKPRESRPVVE